MASNKDNKGAAKVRGLKAMDPNSIRLYLDERKKAVKAANALVDETKRDKDLEKLHHITLIDHGLYNHIVDNELEVLMKDVPLADRKDPSKCDIEAFIQR